MLSVILNWIYILFTTYCTGYAFSCFAKARLHYQIRRTDTLLVAGLVLTTVYAQLFSLFDKVGLTANLLLLAFCLIVILRCHKHMLLTLRCHISQCPTWRRLLIAALFLLWAYFTSRGYMHYDSDLYHAQSIRWIEEYGVVKGLGNLHERFAYNSSFFPLSALYSLKFLLGRSLHTMNGWFALLLSISCLDIASIRKKKKIEWSDFARVAAIYYLTTITNEVVAPASDLSVMCMIFYIVIKWLDHLEIPDGQKDPAPFSLLLVAGVFALTLKLTAGLILVLLAKPAYLLLKEKRWKDILRYLAMGLFTAIPWMARTVIISGYLIYPFPKLDLFSFDWKMNAENIALDAAQILTRGRGLYNAALVDLPITEWFPGWFSNTLSNMEKLLILADISGAGIFVIIAFVTIWKKAWRNLDRLLVLASILCSYLYWQTSAPLARYGYAYILLTAALAWGWVLQKLKWDRPVCFLLLLYGFYKLYMTADYIYDSRYIDTYVWQQDYGTYEHRSFLVDGYTFYTPVNGDRSGYDPFPAAPTEACIALRGDSLKDGFRCRNSSSESSRK